MSALVEVEDLSVTFDTPAGPVAAVAGVSFRLGRERLGIVGESGSGKTQTGRALMGLVRPPGRVTARRLRLAGLDLLALSPRGWPSVRGRRIAMVMQDPRFCLDPVMSVGRQIEETVRIHGGGRRQARERAMDLLAAVRIRDPARVHRAYPHELSGGMGQRAMIAVMLAADPEVLIADEATSALDAHVQNEVLAVLDDLVAARGMGLVMISHDIDMVAGFCDRVLVMSEGRVVETLPAGGLAAADHPYTRALIAATPRLAPAGIGPAGHAAVAGSPRAISENSP